MLHLKIYCGPTNISKGRQHTAYKYWKCVCVSLKQGSTHLKKHGFHAHEAMQFYYRLHITI